MRSIGLIPAFVGKFLGNQEIPRVVTDVKEIGSMLSYDQATIESLLHIDRGPKEGNMTTFGLETVVKNTEAYCLTSSGLKVSKERIGVVDLEAKAAHPVRVLQPLFLEIDADWDKTPYVSGEGNNILGNNGRLTLPDSEIEVPAMDATEDALAYYGATLIRPGDIVRFPNEEFPIWKMEVGPRYVNDFLMTVEGGGFYLEYHTDRPHFHMLREGSGHYLLAKWNADHTKLQMTAFRIPEGHAVYTKMGGIHCDAALIGKDLAVGYTTSENCSTVLLRDPKDRYVNIHFK